MDKKEDTKLETVEKLAKQIETEKDFNKVIELFSQAAEIIKKLLKEGVEQKGRILEIVRELDEYIEKEIKID